MNVVRMRRVLGTRAQQATCMLVSSFALVVSATSAQALARDRTGRLERWRLRGSFFTARMPSLAAADA